MKYSFLWCENLEISNLEYISHYAVPGHIYLLSNLTGLRHIRGTDTLRVLLSKCGAKTPQHLRSTKLRKHIATVSQIMNLQENELDLLASFMGHDIRTHREYYRMPESTIQVAKLSKVLLKMERGDIQGLAGKRLTDIELDPIEGTILINLSHHFINFTIICFDLIPYEIKCHILFAWGKTTSFFQYFKF